MKPLMNTEKLFLFFLILYLALILYLKTTQIKRSNNSISII